MIRTGFLFFLLLPVGLCAQTLLDTSYTPSTFSKAFFHTGNKERDRIFTDYGNLYNRNNVKNYGLALLGAGVMANTKIDSNFQKWHRDTVQSSYSAHELSEFSKIFGEGQYFIPVMITSAFTYRFLQEKQGLPSNYFGDFTDRTMRGYFVGAPTLLIGQLALGGDRPREGDSYWRPFRQDHGISGHSFLGAVPFITAAQMTDRPCVKGVFYALSMLCGWSRVHDDAHYLSQSMLGWYLAYLSVRAVSATENGGRLPRGLTIFPVCGGDEVGIGIHYQY